MENDHLVFSLFLTFFLHLPFGAYGARFKRFTRPWGRCLYIPIVITIILRRSLGIGYGLIPYFIVIALIGQVIGKRLGKKRLGLFPKNAEQA
jgi:hypothetical protein